MVRTLTDSFLQLASITERLLLSSTFFTDSTISLRLFSITSFLERLEYIDQTEERIEDQLKSISR